MLQNHSEVWSTPEAFPKSYPNSLKQREGNSTLIPRWLIWPLNIALLPIAKVATSRRSLLQLGAPAEQLGKRPRVLEPTGGGGGSSIY